MYTTQSNAVTGTAIPTTVYSQGDKLFVHAGDRFSVIAAVGAIGKVRLADGYPVGFGVKTDTRWMNDAAGIASYAAQAINAYPVLRERVVSLENRQADLVAKLKVAKLALQRPLSADYAARLVAEIDRSLSAVQCK